MLLTDHELDPSQVSGVQKSASGAVEEVFGGGKSKEEQEKERKAAEKEKASREASRAQLEAKQVRPLLTQSFLSPLVSLPSPWRVAVLLVHGCPPVRAGAPETNASPCSVWTLALTD